MDGPEAIVITGATGTGKTRLAVEVAERLNGEIISADSRQVYRGMDIGTAKPSPALRERVPHHGLDLIGPDESYSAGRFARGARAWLAGIREREHVPIVVGGTGFFVRALLEPLAPEPDVDQRRRDSLRDRLGAFPVGELKRWLERLDPERSSELAEEGGRQRLSRSVEVALLSGRPHSWWMRQSPGSEALRALVFWTWMPREEVYRRTDARFEAMIEAGLVDEVRRLRQLYPEESPGLRSLGYREILAHLRDECSLEEAIETAQRATRNFVKRQLTWFRHQLPPHASRVDARRPIGELVDAIVESWENEADGALAHPQRG